MIFYTNPSKILHRHFQNSPEKYGPIQIPNFVHHPICNVLKYAYKHKCTIQRKNVNPNIIKIIILTYSYITLLIWDLYFRDLTVKYRIIFHRFGESEKYRTIFHCFFLKSMKYNTIFICLV